MYVHVNLEEKEVEKDIVAISLGLHIMLGCHQHLLCIGHEPQVLLVWYVGS